MKASRWVKWEKHSDGMIVQSGEMPETEVNGWMGIFREIAKRYFDRVRPDHYVYCIKHFGKTGELQRVEFYQEPLTDEKFQKISPMFGENEMVYALHRA